MATLMDPVQAEIVAAFEAGALTHGVDPLRIDTHISHVFLTPDFAYKLKRAIKLNFIDQSTLEKRHALCLEELAVNQRAAPQIYLGVVPIRRDGEGFSLEGEGEIVDWAVLMRRFPGEALLDAIARRGELTADMAADAARALAALHATAPPVHEMGHTADYRHTIHELRRTEADAAGEAGLEAAQSSDDLLNALDAELAHIDPLLEARRRAGKVRRGHGDAHLHNITLWEGRPVLFDALEFDARMATTDVVYDLSFLAMDLLHRDLRAAANAAMNAWWDAFGEDEEALALAPFFMALRASVRMAVLTASGEFAEAQAYRSLARKLLDREAPVLVAIGGLSGVGKTSISRRLAADLPGPCGARRLHTDVLRKQGVDQLAILPEAAYAPEHRAAVYDLLRRHGAAALDAGVSVLADATFQEKAQREAIAQGAGGRPFCGLWLDADLETRLARMASRAKGASDADAAVARAQTPPHKLGVGWFKIDASGALEDTLAAARAAVEACQASSG